MNKSTTLSHARNLNLGIHVVAVEYYGSQYDYEAGCSRTVRTGGATYHAPLKSAAASAAVFARTIRLTADELLANPTFRAEARRVAEAGKTYSSGLLEWEAKPVVQAAVAVVAAEIEAERVAAEKAAAKEAAAEAKRIAADPNVCEQPHKDDEAAKSLRAAIKADPTDLTPQLVLADRLRELGVKEKHIPILIARTVRWHVVTAALKAQTAKGARLRSRIREIAGCGGSNNVSVTLVGFTRHAEGPALTGDAPYSTFKNGGVCQHPGAARRAGYKTEYHADTRAITVGVSWLADLIARS